MVVVLLGHGPTLEIIGPFKTKTAANDWADAYCLNHRHACPRVHHLWDPETYT